MARILVMDDDSQIRGLVRTILEGDGHQVMEAQDGVEGLRQFQDEPSDLVVTNVFMPEQDGLEAIKALRAIVPDLPIIAMSGGAFGGKVESSGVLGTASRLGASCTFQKPFDAPTFAGAVRDLLGPS